jgi:hypothetical protein
MKSALLLGFTAVLVFAQNPPGADCAACKAILQQEIAAAQKAVDYVEKQTQLGQGSPLDGYGAQTLLVQLRRDLAAFEGGLVPALPPAPQTSEGIAARRRFREQLQAEIGLAEKGLLAEQAKRELGATSEADLLRAQLRHLDLQLEAAAFDAGLSFPRRVR